MTKYEKNNNLTIAIEYNSTMNNNKGWIIYKRNEGDNYFYTTISIYV